MDYTKTRRQKVFEAMPIHSAMILCANSKKNRNGDAEYLFRQDSDFYYLSGFEEDKALLLLLKTDKNNQFIVFCEESTPVEARWQGARLGREGVQTLLEPDAVYLYSDLATQMPKLLNSLNAPINTVYYTACHANYIQKHLESWFNHRVPAQKEAKLILSELRLIKDKHEIQLMQKAADISSEAHIRAMKACKHLKFEYELEAELLYEFTRQGSRSPAYTSIVGGGNNACILHYINNQSELKKGDLVLIDAGAEYQYYAADITRVFPINGRFSEPQQKIYNLVLKAQLAGIDLARPNQAFDEMQTVIVKIIQEGLMALGIIKKPEDYIKYYMHRSGHWLGLDVHDAGEYLMDGQSRLLKPGMVLTVEPGLYLPLDAPIDEKWRGIGVRIEDDVLVTEGDPRVLSDKAPKTIQAIEQLMNHV